MKGSQARGHSADRSEPIQYSDRGINRSANMHVNMKSLNFSSDDGIFTGKITVVVKNKSMLKKLIDNLKKINGIFLVTKIF